jgi:hypothetical protein
MQSVPITTDVVSSSLDQGEVYKLQHYVIKFVSDLRQVGGFLRVLRTDCIFNTTYMVLMKNVRAHRKWPLWDVSSSGDVGRF